MQKKQINILVIGSFKKKLSKAQATVFTDIFRELWRLKQSQIHVTNTNGQHLGKYITYAARQEACLQGWQEKELCLTLAPVRSDESEYYGCMRNTNQTAAQLKEELQKKHLEEMIQHQAYAPKGKYDMVIIIGGGENTKKEYDLCRTYMNHLCCTISLKEYGGTGEEIFQDTLQRLNRDQYDLVMSMYAEDSRDRKTLAQIIGDLIWQQERPY